jgi:cytochrome c oxidase assembly protein subunit 15
VIASNGQLHYASPGTRTGAAIYRPWLHRIALLTAAATFPLIFMGGLVTSHGAGMSVPDWPNSYGYNMFLFPPRLWVGGILYEHTHRLMGTVVGMLSIVLTFAAWKMETRRWVRWVATGGLGAVIFQGVLGGLRVVWVKLDLAIVHACFAQAFFCFAAFTAVVTSRWWIETPERTNPRAKWLIRLAIACVLAIYAQLIVGATMRHYDAGLAIPDLPWAYGKLLPPTDDAGLKTINAARAWESGLKPVTLAQVWLHFGHRLGAVIVSALVTTLVVTVLARKHRPRKLIVPATLLAALLVTQVTLGVFTVLYRKPADVASAHVAVGALVLVTTFVLTIRAVRLYGRRVSTVVPFRSTGVSPVSPVNDVREQQLVGA